MPRFSNCGAPTMASISRRLALAACDVSSWRVTRSLRVIGALAYQSSHDSEMTLDALDAARVFQRRRVDLVVVHFAERDAYDRWKAWSSAAAASTRLSWSSRRATQSSPS